LYTNNNNTISRNSTAEIAFNNWKKNKELDKDNYSYLTDLYINEHEKPRSDHKIAYETYAVEKEEVIDEFYKKHKSTNINKLTTNNIADILLKPDSRIFTKYNLPSLTDIAFMYEADNNNIISKMKL